MSQSSAEEFHLPLALFLGSSVGLRHCLSVITLSKGPPRGAYNVLPCKAIPSCFTSADIQDSLSRTSYTFLLTPSIYISSETSRYVPPIDTDGDNTRDDTLSPGSQNDLSPAQEMAQSCRGVIK